MLVLGDVAKSADVKQMVEKVVGKFGGIDILVNNAALTDHANIFDSTEQEFDKVIAVSLKGPYLVTKFVAEQMRTQGRGGKILNFGSTSGMIGRFDGIAYAAAKAGVINMTRAMAVQLAQYKIRVNCVVPNRSGSPVGYDDDVAGNRTFENLAGRLGTADDQAGDGDGVGVRGPVQRQPVAVPVDDAGLVAIPRPARGELFKPPREGEVDG